LADCFEEFFFVFGPFSTAWLTPPLPSTSILLLELIESAKFTLDTFIKSVLSLLKSQSFISLPEFFEQRLVFLKRFTSGY
jgi:hypothetical protein